MKIVDILGRDIEDTALYSVVTRNGPRSRWNQRITVMNGVEVKKFHLGVTDTVRVGYVRED